MLTQSMFNLIGFILITSVNVNLMWISYWVTGSGFLKSHIASAVGSSKVMPTQQWFAFGQDALNLYVTKAKLPSAKPNGKRSLRAEEPCTTSSDRTVITLSTLRRKAPVTVSTKYRGTNLTQSPGCYFEKKRKKKKREITFNSIWPYVDGTVWKVKNRTVDANSLLATIHRVEREGTFFIYHNLSLCDVGVSCFVNKMRVNSTNPSLEMKLWLTHSAPNGNNYAT